MWKCVMLFLIFYYQVFQGSDLIDLEVRKLHKTGSSLDKTLISERYKTSFDEDIEMSFKTFLQYIDTARDEGFITVKRTLTNILIHGRNHAQILMHKNRKILIDVQDGQHFWGSNAVLFIQLILTYTSNGHEKVDIPDMHQRRWSFCRVMRPGTCDQSYVVGVLV